PWTAAGSGRCSSPSSGSPNPVSKPATNVNIRISSHAPHTCPLEAGLQSRRRPRRVGEESPSMRMLKRAKRPDPRMNRRECEADADLAAEMARDAAIPASEWSVHAGVGEDDAAEAAAAAARARLAAERA